MTRQIEQSDISKLVPISGLTYDNQAQIVKSAILLEFPAGHLVFKRGQIDKKTLYVLSGEVEMRDENGRAMVVAAGSKDAVHPLAHQQPRQVSATAKTNISLIAIDNDLMDVLLTWDQTASYVVSEIDEDSQNIDSNCDWMTTVLRSDIFKRIPASNIQKMFMRMEQIPVCAGEIIVRQGDPGDYYYIVQRGECEVLRTMNEGQRQVRLAILKPGDGFGEEALISESVRNATIQMCIEGTLVRLSKKDFNELLQKPVINEINYEQAKAWIKSGNVMCVDVRLENEFQVSHIKGSINIPLYLLRLRAAKLDLEKKYIICCDTGSRSASAAYVLSERGFTVAVLVGGLIGLNRADRNVG